MNEASALGKRDRPTSNPGGMSCENCGCTFIGDPDHKFCGVCVEAVAKELAAEQRKHSGSQGKVSRYPRPGQTIPLRPTQIRTCDAIACANPAVVIREIQFGYMRGTDDGSVNCCIEHKRIPAGDVKTWVGQFPKESWK